MRCTEEVWVSEESAHWGEGGDNGSHLTPADVSSSGHPIVCHKERKKRKLGQTSCKYLKTPNLFCLPPRYKAAWEGTGDARFTNSCVCSSVPIFLVPKWSHTMTSHPHHWDAMWVTSTDAGCFYYPLYSQVRWRTSSIQPLSTGVPQENKPFQKATRLTVFPVPLRIVHSYDHSRSTGDDIMHGVWWLASAGRPNFLSGSHSGHGIP